MNKHKNKMETIEKLLSGTEVKINNKQQEVEQMDSSKRTVKEKEMKWIINALIGIPIVLTNEYERWECEMVLNEFKLGRSQIETDETLKYLEELESVLN